MHYLRFVGSIRLFGSGDGVWETIASSNFWNLIQQTCLRYHAERHVSLASYIQGEKSQT